MPVTRGAAIETIPRMISRIPKNVMFTPGVESK
jgi:hypothetical protein